MLLDLSTEETNLYISCIREEITKRLRKSLNCTLPGFEGLLLNNRLNLPTCNTNESAFIAKELFQNVSYEFLEEGSFNKCFMPCKQQSYLQNLKYYHQTAYNELKPNIFDLTIAYSSLDVTTKTETLVYDFGDFLSAAGGNMGLFLGFSCLGCMWHIIEKFRTSL